MTAPSYDQIIDALEQEMQALPRPEALQLEVDVMDKVDTLAEGATCPSVVASLLSVCQPFPALMALINAWLERLQACWPRLRIAL